MAKSIGTLNPATFEGGSAPVAQLEGRHEFIINAGQGNADAEGIRDRKLRLDELEKYFARKPDGTTDVTIEAFASRKVLEEETRAKAAESGAKDITALPAELQNSPPEDSNLLDAVSAENALRHQNEGDVSLLPYGESDITGALLAGKAAMEAETANLQAQIGESDASGLRARIHAAETEQQTLELLVNSIEAKLNPTVPLATAAQTVTEAVNELFAEAAQTEHDGTLEGDGVPASPLAVSQSVLGDIAARALQTDLAAEEAARQAELAAHAGDAGAHVTLAEKAGWDAKLDAVSASAAFTGDGASSPLDIAPGAVAAAHLDAALDGILAKLIEESPAR
jgi:hypothetical protein